MITKMTMMNTDGKISMMMTKQIINNCDDNNQHDRGEADAGEANEDVARISKMTTIRGSVAASFDITIMSILAAM